MSGFCGQFLSIRWTAPLTLRSGDYLLTNETGSVLDCDGRLEYSMSYSPITHLDPIPYNNKYFHKGKHCSDSIRFYSPPLESYYYTQQIVMVNVSKLVYIDLWLPGGSYIHNISGCINVMRFNGQIIPFPCYIPTEFIYSLQADELCHRYYETSRNFSIDIKNKTCEENRSSCTTALATITSLDCTINCANLSVNLTIESRVAMGMGKIFSLWGSP